MGRGKWTRSLGMRTLWALGLAVGCGGAPFTPVASCEGLNSTFELQEGVTRTCAFYQDLAKTAFNWDQASGFFAGNTSHLTIYVHADETWSHGGESVAGLWYDGLDQFMELGQSGVAMPHELLHVVYGQFHHEGWGTEGSSPDANVVGQIPNPDGPGEIEVKAGSFWQRTLEFSEFWPPSTESGG
jgi:hypothetical protein